MKKPLLMSAAVLAVAFVLAGCATKRHGRAVEVTGTEAAAYTCDDVQLELAKARGFLDQVNRDSKFSGADVLAFLGDFGIGNALERSAAIKSGNERISQLSALEAEKCKTTAEPISTPTSSTPARSITTIERPQPIVERIDSGSEGIRALQAELTIRGFYDGRFTGVLDADTQEAISAFQASAGLPVHGFAGPETIRALGL